MAASFRHGTAASRSAAACSTSWRAASMRVAMSASRKATAWWLKIGVPKVTRSLEYLSAASKAARAMPTDWAAMPMRPPSSEDSAMR
jgi:hypothetical protein